MPNPGQVNNPSGANSFNRFAPEPAYGEATQQANLAGGAPLAGQPIAAGPLGAPRQAQRSAVRGKPAPQGAPVSQAPSMQPSYQASLASQWAAIAAIPGASDLVKQYALEAQAALG